MVYSGGWLLCQSPLPISHSNLSSRWDSCRSSLVLNFTQDVTVKSMMKLLCPCLKFKAIARYKKLLTIRKTLKKNACGKVKTILFVTIDAGRPLNRKQDEIWGYIVGVRTLGHMALFLWLPSQLWFWLFPLLKCNFSNILAPLTYSRVAWTTVSRQTSITVIAFQPWNTELAVAGQMEGCTPDSSKDPAW